MVVVSKEVEEQEEDLAGEGRDHPLEEEVVEEEVAEEVEEEQGEREVLVLGRRRKPWGNFWTKQKPWQQNICKHLTKLKQH